MKNNIFQIITNYIVKKNYSEAESFLQNLIENEKDDFDYKLKLVEIYLFQRKFDNAKKLINELLEIQPHNFKLELLHAKFYNKIKKYRNAIEILNLLLIENTNNYFLLLEIGISLIGIKKFEDAIYNLNRALKLKPYNHFILYQLSLAYKNNDEFDKAIDCIEKAYNISKNNFYYSQLLKYKQHNLSTDKKVNDVKNILKLKSKSNNPNLKSYLGENYIKNKQYIKAKFEFLNAIKLNPDNLYFKSRYYYVLNKCKEYKTVFDEVPELIKKFSDNIYLMNAFTQACKKLNKNEKGIEFYIDLFKIVPNSKLVGRQIKMLKKGLNND